MEVEVCEVWDVCEVRCGGPSAECGRRAARSVGVGCGGVTSVLPRSRRGRPPMAPATPSLRGSSYHPPLVEAVEAVGGAGDIRSTAPAATARRDGARSLSCYTAQPDGPTSIALRSSAARRASSPSP